MQCHIGLDKLDPVFYLEGSVYRKQKKTSSCLKDTWSLYLGIWPSVLGGYTLCFSAHDHEQHPQAPENASPLELCVLWQPWPDGIRV